MGRNGRRHQSRLRRQGRRLRMVLGSQRHRTARGRHYQRHRAASTCRVPRCRFNKRCDGGIWSHLRSGAKWRTSVLGCQLIRPAWAWQQRRAQIDSYGRIAWRDNRCERGILSDLRRRCGRNGLVLGRWVVWSTWAGRRFGPRDAGAVGRCLAEHRCRRSLRLWHKDGRHGVVLGRQFVWSAGRWDDQRPVLPGPGVPACLALALNGWCR